MRYLNTLHEGQHIQDVYLCKQKSRAVTKNGKDYENVVLQDRTGTIDAKIWDPDSPGIADFDVMDYIYVSGMVSSFNGQLQASLKQVRVAQEGEFIPADYVPVTEKNTTVMYQELCTLKDGVKDVYLKKLLDSFFVEDKAFIDSFRAHSAAKTIHHSFVGGLLEHTLTVAGHCEYFCRCYPMLNHDILITTALLHDIGKTRELSLFPQNDYTDDGQLLGHIMIGAEMIHDHCAAIEGFPEELERKVKHCILAHHGKYEYGSPKKPAIMEAVALNLADDLDAKLETLTEIFKNNGTTDQWIGYNKLFESNLRRTD